MSHSTQFNPLATYIAKKPMTLSGKQYNVGDALVNTGLTSRKLRQLYETGKICFPWQYQALLEKEKQKADIRAAKLLDNEKKAKKEKKESKPAKSSEEPSKDPLEEKLEEINQKFSLLESEE